MKVFLAILLVFALSVSAFGVDQRILDGDVTGDDDSTNEPIKTSTPKPSVNPTPSVTASPSTTTVEETTAPPPPIVKPTVPDDIKDIVDNFGKDENSGSQNTNTNDKETITQPPITVNNDTTNNFIDTIKNISSPDVEPTFPEVTTRPDSIQTKPTQSKLNSFDFPKKTTYLGVDMGEMSEKPSLTGTLGNSVEKTSIVVTSSKSTSEGVSLNIISSVDNAVIVNTEIDVYASKSKGNSGGGRMLQDEGKEVDLLTVTECGIFKNITNTTMENVKINIYGDVILNCTDGYNGIFANSINNSHLINVRIEFMNKNSRIISIESSEGETYGLIAGKIYQSSVFYTRVVGDILHIQDKKTTSKELQESGSGDIVVSPLFGEVESTDITNSYSDINNVLITSDSIVYGGIAGSYIPGIPSVERLNNDSNLPVVMNNTFAVIRKGLTISNEKADKTQAIIGGLIGKVNGNEEVVVESCYSSTIMDGLDHANLRYAGFIGDNSNNATFNFTFSYSVMNVKSAYLHDKAELAALVCEAGNITHITYDRCYGYISSPFILNRTEENMFGNLTYYYVGSNGFNKTEILVRYLQQSSNGGVVVYGSGADTYDENYEEADKAVEKLITNGYTVNPYSKTIPINTAPGVTPSGGLYLSKDSMINWGVPFSPTGRTDPVAKIEEFILPNPISTRKICPNNCGGNGKCMNGICYCNEGYNGVYCQYKTCPYGYMFNDPSITVDRPEGIAQVCSNQGYCNKESGRCECFPGYEGNACQRKQCPNECSNHGVCITINKVKSENMNDYEMNYERNYNKSDGEKVQVCVCDKEYEGYDCSLRKCPIGYSQMSDCDAQPQSTITFTFDKKDTGKNIYLKYTDPFGKVWYTLGFDYTKRDEWEKHLLSLPTGTISIDRVDDITPTSDKNIVIQITYSKHQTGRQIPIEVLSKAEVEKLSKKYSFITTKNAANINDSDSDTVKVTPSYEDSIPGSPCSGNGICDSVKGLCNCFSGFYGNSCSAHSSVV